MLSFFRSIAFSVLFKIWFGFSVVTFRGTAGDSLRHDEEEQCGDYEVYTTGMQTVDLGERRTGQDPTEGFTY